MYGEQITPNQHALARQFGVVDNFYCSGEVSGDGHVWSMAAITSDYTEKTWQILYRGKERTYDYEGEVANGVPLEEGIPDVNEPASGYVWALVSRSGLTHRNYGEFVQSLWCDSPQQPGTGAQGTPLFSAQTCPALLRDGPPARGINCRSSLSCACPMITRSARELVSQPRPHRSPTMISPWDVLLRPYPIARTGKTQPSASWRMTLRMAPTTWMRIAARLW